MRSLILSLFVLTFGFAALAEDAYTKTYGPLENVQWVTKAPTSKTKYKLVVFWATWCSPCIAEIGRLNDMQNTFGEQLDVIGLNVEAMNNRELTPEAMTQIEEIAKTKMQYAVAVDQNKHNERTLLNALSVSHIPHALLIDSKGALVWTGHPTLLEDDLLKKLTTPNYVGSKEHKAEIEKERESAEASNRMSQKFAEANKLFKDGKWEQLVLLVTEAEQHAKYSLLPNYKAHALLNELGRADEAYAYAFEVAHQDDEMAYYRLLNMLQEVFYSQTPPPAEVRESELRKLLDILFDKLRSAEFYAEWVRAVHFAMVQDFIGDKDRARLILLQAYGMVSEDERPDVVRTIQNMGYMVVCEADSCQVIERPKKSCDENLTN